MVRDYEAVFITAADLNNEEQAELLDRVRGFIARFEGQICREYFWGRRKLAYPIKKKDYGIYHLWYLSVVMGQCWKSWSASLVIQSK